MKKILAVMLVLLTFAGCTGTVQNDNSVESPPNAGEDIEDQQELEPEESVSHSIREEYGFIDLGDDLATEEEKLLMALVNTHIIQFSFESGNDVDPDSLIGFFITLSFPRYNEVELNDENTIVDEESGEHLYPAELVESIIQKHFDVSSEHLQSGMYYVADAGAYWCAGLGSVANAKILDVETRDDIRIIQYELYGNKIYAGSGVLEIKGAGADYRYRSNHYERKPKTPEELALEEQYIQVRQDMSFEEKVTMGAACSGLYTSSWETPEENHQADLISLYAFLLELGEVALPPDTEIDRLWKYPYVDAATVEAVVLEHFDITSEFLRSGPVYREERDAYWVTPANMTVTCIPVDYAYDGNLLTIQFDIYQSYSRDWAVELVVLTDGAGGYVYQNCRGEWVG